MSAVRDQADVHRIGWNDRPKTRSNKISLRIGRCLIDGEKLQYVVVGIADSEKPKGTFYNDGRTF
ncbi:MAG: hypothetical protein ACI9PY_003680 [Ascidiaceihabitans sp.]|jgi:hypothetical protein